MTVQALPWAIQGQSHSAEVARNLVSAIFGAPVAALVEGIGITTAGGAHGIVMPGDLNVTQNGSPDRNVIVAAGRAIIRSTEAASLLAGTYSFLNDAAVLALTAASDPTNPRIDLIIAQVRDSNYSGANTDARIAVVTGTPAAVPVTPTVPDSCLVLAQVAVAATTTTVVNANITDKRTRAYTLGGLAAYNGSTFRPSGASLIEGLLALDTSLNRLEIGNDTPALSALIDPAYGALKAWTPTVVQSAGVAVTNNGSWYQRIGRFIHGTYLLTVTGAGVAANVVTISTPFTASGGGGSEPVGQGYIVDASAGLLYTSLVIMNSATTFKMYQTLGGGTAALLTQGTGGGGAFAAALAVGDVINGSFIMQAGADA